MLPLSAAGGSMTFNATVRLREEWRPSYTAPIPPRPINLTGSKSPRIASAMNSSEGAPKVSVPCVSGPINPCFRRQVGHKPDKILTSKTTPHCRHFSSTKATLGFPNNFTMSWSVIGFCFYFQPALHWLGQRGEWLGADIEGPVLLFHSGEVRENL